MEVNCDSVTDSLGIEEEGFWPSSVEDSSEVDPSSAIVEDPGFNTGCSLDVEGVDSAFDSIVDVPELDSSAAPDEDSELDSVTGSSELDLSVVVEEGAVVDSVWPICNPTGIVESEEESSWAETVKVSGSDPVVKSEWHS